MVVSGESEVREMNCIVIFLGCLEGERERDSSEIR